MNKQPPQQAIPVPEAADRTRTLIDRTLRGTSPLVREMTEHLAESRGKGVRTLLLLHCSADGEGRAPADAVRAAAAVELFHLATLVHDDIIDDADLRRGRTTVQKQFGKRGAVLCGDYLLCMAMQLLAPLHESYADRAPLTPVFTRALASVCLGEMAQFHNNRNLDLTVPGYLRIIAGKTSALFYLSAYAGALVGRRDDRQSRRLARFGRYVGLIFQIIDDVKDYEFSEEEARKPVGSDLLEGVVTLPLILAMAREPLLRDLAGEALRSPEKAGGLVQSVRQQNGTGAARELAARYAAKADRLLHGVEPAVAEPLQLLLNKALGAAAAF